MDALTGGILSMCSNPNFDPNEIAYEWDGLISDEDAPLINRATQGLYPPGSTFKIITAAAAIENYSGYADFTFECSGKAVFGEHEIRCSNSTAHGTVDLARAIAVSCNGFFAALSEKFDVSLLHQTAENFLFNSAIGYPLEYSIPSFTADKDSSTKELLDTYFGQGKTVVSPLYMALCTSAVVNGGLIMTPYIVDYAETYDGSIINRAVPIVQKQAIMPETADLLKQLMYNTVNSGTGRGAAIEGLNIGGKTGTAQNASGDDHSWFISFMETDHGYIVVSILLENTGGGTTAISLAKNIFQFLSNIANVN